MTKVVQQKLLACALTHVNPTPARLTIGIVLQRLVQPGNTQFATLGQIFRGVTLQGIGVRIDVRKTKFVIILQRGAASGDGPLKTGNGVLVASPDVINDTQMTIGRRKVGINLQRALDLDHGPSTVPHLVVRPPQLIKSLRVSGIYFYGLLKLFDGPVIFTQRAVVQGQTRVKVTKTRMKLDGQPVCSGLPTSRWRPDGIVVDPYRIPIFEDAPSSTARLLVGMYDFNTMQRLPVLGPDGSPVGDSLHLTDVEIR